MKQALVVLALLGIGSGAGAAETCEWLAVEKVNQAFPEYAPWQVGRGGTGQCSFWTDAARLNEFNISQMIEGSAAEAADTTRQGRTNMHDQSIPTRPEPELGKEGFSYSFGPEGAGAGQYLLSISGHRKNMTVDATLSLRAPISAAYHDGAVKLALAALAMVDDEHAVAAMSNCPYFDPVLIRRLLPGKDFKQNVMGSGLCMALAGGVVVRFTSVQDSNIDRLYDAMRGEIDSSCTTEPLPQLGKGATIEYACGGEVPVTTVRFVSGTKLIEFSFVPERPSTATQRATLIELAEHALTH